MFNDGKHIAEILGCTTCKKHHAPQGAPCWHVHPCTDNAVILLDAICGSRIKRAGYVGKVSPSSLRRVNRK